MEDNLCIGETLPTRKAKTSKGNYLKFDLRERGWTRWHDSPLVGKTDQTCHRYGGGEYYLFNAERSMLPRTGPNGRRNTTNGKNEDQEEKAAEG